MSQKHEYTKVVTGVQLLHDDYSICFKDLEFALNSSSRRTLENLKRSEQEDMECEKVTVNPLPCKDSH